MADRVFVDTNLFVYADDDDACDKRDHARSLLRELISQGRAVVSTQVLQEFFVVATTKLSIPADLARQRIEALMKLDVVLLRPDIVVGAIDLHRLHRLSFWDALIVRAAAVAGCAQLFSEDLDHGRVIDGVTIENPFRVIG